MKHCKRLLIAGAAMALFTNLQAASEGWTTDYEAAKTQAAEEGKDLLLEFTGSDWCLPCKKLTKDVFKKQEFKDGVKDKFVLVKLDFPRSEKLLKKMGEDTREQNDELQKKYMVRGYPTIMLTDAEGRPYASTGFRPVGPEEYVKHLEELQEIRVKRDEAFESADGSDGVEKAKALIAALKTLEISDDLTSSFYGGVAEKIKAADPNDESGYIEGIEQKKRLAEFETKLNQLGRSGDFEGALKLVDETMEAEELDTQMTQSMLMTKAMIHFRMENLAESLVEIDKAIEVDPEGENNDRIKAMREHVVKSMKEANPGEEEASGEETETE